MSCKEVETNLDVGILNNEEWVHRWAIGKTGFHQSRHDPLLETAEDQMFGGNVKSVFAPLCGKSPDLIWMYNRGHTVCGVELVEQAVTEFFTENNIPNDVQDLGDKGKKYKSKDGRLVIFCADLFDMNVNLCGQFDVIWDSRSFVAINTADHNRYVDLVLSLMKEVGVYYLSTLEYDSTVWPGPPHSIPEHVIQEAYGARCKLELVQETNIGGQDINRPRGETGKPEPSPGTEESCKPQTSTGTEESGKPQTSPGTEESGKPQTSPGTEESGKPQTSPGTEESGKPQTSPGTPSGAAAAIRTSSFNYNRWHKLTFK